jgi:hypothetical protein
LDTPDLAPVTVGGGLVLRGVSSISVG